MIKKTKFMQQTKLGQSFKDRLIPICSES